MMQALELRHAVFVLEQGVPAELEIDEYDAIATQLVVLQEGQVVATMRLLPHGDAMKIGRVAVRRDLRRKGIGTRLMRRGIMQAAECGFRSAILDAQVCSMPFYGRMGFVGEGEAFDDAGIPHMRMRLALEKCMPTRS